MSDETLRRLTIGRDDIAVRDDSGRWWRIDDEPATAVRQLVAAIASERDEARAEVERLSNQIATMAILATDDASAVVADGRDVGAEGAR